MKNKYLLLIFLSLLLSALLRLPYFQYDFIFVDEAHWANGASTLHRGGQLYIDMALDKNPPIFWYCALLFKIFGENMTAIHMGALLLVWTTSVLLFLLGSRFFSKGAGAAASLIHAVASTTYYIPRIIGMNSETMMNLFTTLAALFFLYALTRERAAGFFAAGFFSCCAVFTKPVAAPEFALLVLFILWGGTGAIRQRVYSMIILVSGFVLGLGVVTGIMVRGGILAAWWDQAVLYAFRYVGRISSDAFLMKSFRVTAAFCVIFAWLLILAAASHKARAGNSAAYKFAGCWLAAAFIGVVMGRRYYANYFLQIIPALSLLGGIGLHYLWDRRKEKGFRMACRFCCAALILSFVWFHSRTAANWLALALPEIHNVKLWDMGMEDRKNREIAEYIRSRSGAEDKIFIWGSKPQLLFLTGRQSVTGWMDYDVADDYPPGSGEPDNQRRTAELLRQARPLFIADVQKVLPIEKNPVFWKVVQEFYRPDTQIHGSRIYRLRERMDPGLTQNPALVISGPPGTL